MKQLLTGFERLFHKDENYQKFQSLSKIQIQILYKRRKQGKSVEKSAEELIIGESTLYDYMKPVHTLFGVKTAKGEGKRMWKELMDIIGGYVDELDDKKVDKWKPKKYSPKTPPTPRPVANPAPPRPTVRWEDLREAPTVEESVLHPPRDPGRAIRDLLNQRGRGILLVLILVIGGAVLLRYTLNNQTVALKPTLPNSTATLLNSTPTLLSPTAGYKKAPIRETTTIGVRPTPNGYHEVSSVQYYIDSFCLDKYFDQANKDTYNKSAYATQDSDGWRCRYGGTFTQLEWTQYCNYINSNDMNNRTYVAVQMDQRDPLSWKCFSP